MKEEVLAAFQKLDSSERLYADELVILIIAVVVTIIVAGVVLFIVGMIAFYLMEKIREKCIKPMKVKIISAVLKGKNGTAYAQSSLYIYSSVLSQKERIYIRLLGRKKSVSENGSYYSFSLHRDFYATSAFVSDLTPKGLPVYTLYGLPVIVAEFLYIQNCSALQVKVKLDEEPQEAIYFGRHHDGLSFFNKQGGRLVLKSDEKEPAEKVKRYRVLPDKDDYKLEVW